MKKLSLENIISCILIFLIGYLAGRKIAFINIQSFLEQSLIEDKDFKYFGLKSRAEDYLFTSIEGLFYSGVTGLFLLIVLVIVGFSIFKLLRSRRPPPSK